MLVNPARADHATPTILDPRSASDRAVIDSLVTDGVTVVLDTLDAQARGLSALVPRPGADVLDEPPRWVHYPWRRTLVRVLGPRGFRRLRLDRNRNKITAEEQDRFGAAKIGVVGLSVGHAVAHTLALEGLCGELRVADFDELELSNLNRIPSTVLDLGENKTDIVSRRIGELDPYLTVRVEARGITSDTVDDFLDGLDIVVEECDSLDVKVLLREAAKRHRIPVIMETSDRGLLDVERFDLEPDRPIFHGAVGTLDSGALTGLSTRDKAPHVMSILGASDVSARFAASMVEVDRTVSTWPQLGSDVALGGATVAAVVRRIVLGHSLPSGRTRIDVDGALDVLGTAESDRDPADEPETTTTAEAATSVVDSIVEAARRAPSGGNVQPWTLDTSDDRVTITLDPHRTTGLDVAHRGSRIAVGAAVFNARVAAARAGLTAVPTIVDENDERGNVRVDLTLASTPDVALEPLYEAMMARSTNRHSGTPSALSEEVVRDLCAAAAAEDGSAVVITDRAALSDIGEILAESDRLRYLTTTLHAEMMSELRWPGDDDPDTGIDVATLALDATDLVKLDVARRPDVMRLLADWDTGTALGDDTRVRMATTSAVLVVFAPGVTGRDHVVAGSAVERAWITAELHGLAVHPVSPVFLYASEDHEFDALSPRYAERLRALRHRFLDTVGQPRETPVGLVLRLSHCTIPPVRSRRRPR
ncbi:Rv1355c family protein [Rhodococcus sp. BP-349]|uniref:Rv1355c family protein n=1 Tax=unclassified Rhodococcus (in: high G+C Gram-positive bacteria) TaxID=192944 RepID=UPI001C9A3079|nr:MULTISPECIES: Rv1355c family protein [unclassified Rhodococcus (in: high G+C Gram-positive bacteria)]MBY6540633.1 Rv1355c family protein [Rhodococcus sp. BP-363]MBY6545342.1 Rv1355c family protein [Rhodococcus sp. BP-369]MBY6564572.1 Rv1355c family protein [Rhodococcus sp. BP-370]MBY6578492.1 Rv1355c family protein [Rhodococcus sp. BP-364]MBY6587793.1 Rv1355c family protein [Rhodococcus sp. BP-358]